MSIERITKNVLVHEPFPFTTIFNEVLQGIKHTGALGVYCYLASKPAGWAINKKEISNHFQCGRDHIDTCFRYLKEIGAIVVFSVRGENGRISHWNTVLKRHLSTVRETQDVETLQCGDTAPINKRVLEKKEIIKKEKIKQKESALSRADAQASIHSVNINYEYAETLYPVASKTMTSNKSEFIIDQLFKDNPHNIPKGHIEDWIKIRKKKRAPITPLVWSLLNKNLSCYVGNKIEAFEEMISRGWSTFKAEWLSRQNTYQAKQPKLSVDDHNMQLKQALTSGPFSIMRAMP